MSERRSQEEETLLNATSFAAESVCCWNFSTQIGASAATTAVSARWLAIFSAVLPSVHPSDETRQPRTQQRRPLHPIPLVSSRDGSSLRHLGFRRISPSSDQAGK